MAKAKNPVTIARQFKIDSVLLSKLGVLNSTLAIDTQLFIDPLLLKKSKHIEIRTDAVSQYSDHFEKIIKLLQASKQIDDVAWKAAKKMLSFHEIQGTCLGYGAGSIRGSGFGNKLTDRVLNIANEIVAIGVSDPDLFCALSLFEPDIGPDRISDMTTNIIAKALIQFNARILNDLKLKGRKFNIGLHSGVFLKNPFESLPTPIIFVPTDILRDLPTAHDWDSIASSARKNEELRGRINRDIASIWTKKTKRDKNILKNQALTSKAAFNTLLDSIKNAKTTPYDVDSDPSGIIKWAEIASEFAIGNPLKIKKKKISAIDDLQKIVSLVIEQFTHLIEYCGLNKELFDTKKKPKHESASQRLFFAVAYAYCKANNIDISPEIDTGNGKIDFKFSIGFEARILVEIKLSRNPKVKSGYTAQLEEYKKSQDKSRAFYVVIDVGQMGNKEIELIKIKNDFSSKGSPLSELIFIDATIKPSPSKLKT